ncbi:QRIC2 protein [Vespula maculifrons]|uniref:QRIC2 protein n=1 Tax=Vespula maculifrons TaxID=7453 RepID=A0ABD2D228_VESMC
MQCTVDQFAFRLSDFPLDIRLDLTCDNKGYTTNRRDGLAWLGLAWLGLGWLGLGWAGLAWVGLSWLGLGWVGLTCLDLRCFRDLIIASHVHPNHA